jgi:hypothetical protein
MGIEVVRAWKYARRSRVSAESRQAVVVPDQHQSRIPIRGFVQDLVGGVAEAMVALTLGVP